MGGSSESPLLQPETESAPRRPRPRDARGENADPLERLTKLLADLGGGGGGDSGSDNDNDSDGNEPRGASGLLRRLARANGGRPGLTKNKKQWSPLHVAAQDGKLVVARALLQRGGFVDPREDDNWTPLILAAQNGHIEMVTLLLEYGADIDARANDDRTALFQAAQRSNHEMVRLLLSHKPNVNLALKEGSTPLWMAVNKACDKRDGDGDGDANAKPSRGGPASATVLLLLRAGADVNRADGLGISPLSLAVLRKNMEIAEMLLQHGADVNCVDGLQAHTPLINAAINQNPELVRLCLAHGANVHATERQGWTALHVAVRKMGPSTAEVVRQLIKAGANVHAQTNEGGLVMQIAAQEGFTELVRLLVELGHADVNVPGRSQRTTLFSAVANGHVETFHYLVDRGAKLNVVDQNGTTLIHMAASQTDTDFLREVVTMCVRAGVDIDVATTDKNLTALHIASMSDDESVALALLDLGAAP